jgi:hypothetical protein
MITKFLLIVWIGSGTSQTFSHTVHDTMAECKAAEAVIIDLLGNYRYSEKYGGCRPFTYAGE